MIYDSGIWRTDLQNELTSIRDFFENTDLTYDQEFEDSSDPKIEERDMLEVAFIKLQKFSIYSSIVTRKFIEASKISDELLKINFPIKLFRKLTDSNITMYDAYEIEKHYEIDNPKESTISIKRLTDLLIHSFHFMPKYDWQKADPDLPDDDIENWEAEKIMGFYFSSDKTKNKQLMFIDLEIYFKIIEDVINDFIRRIVFNAEKEIIIKSINIESQPGDDEIILKKKKIVNRTNSKLS